MAAGLGSRFGGLKQMASVGKTGEWLLDFSIQDAIKVGFDHVILVIQSSMQADMQAHLARYKDDAVRFSFVHQEVITLLPDVIDFDLSLRRKPWGTAHAALCAAPCIDAPCVILNADDYYGPHALELLGHFLDVVDYKKPFAAFLGYELGKTLSKNGPVSRAICDVSSNGTLNQLQEYTALIEGPQGIIDTSAPNKTFSASALVSMNAWSFSQDFFAFLKNDFLNFITHLSSDTFLSKEYYLPIAAIDFSKSYSFDIQIIKTLDTPWGITYKGDLSDFLMD